MTGLSLNPMTGPQITLQQAQQALERAQAAERAALRMKAKYYAQYETRKNVSAALWCDEKQHAFSANDRKRAEYTRRKFDEDGDPYTETYTVCGPCDASKGMFQALPAVTQDAVPGMATSQES